MNQCQATTKKGTRCSNQAVDGSVYCGILSHQSFKGKAPATPSSTFLGTPPSSPGPSSSGLYASPGPYSDTPATSKKISVSRRPTPRKLESVMLSEIDPLPLFSPSTKLVVTIPFVESHSKKLAKFLKSTGVSNGIHTYSLQKNAKPLDLFLFLAGNTEAEASYQTISGRVAEVPLNLYRDITRISGPVCLQSVYVDGKIYHFFGDIHFSNTGLCYSPDFSRELYYILEKIAKTPDGPSIDIFTETSRDILKKYKNDTPLGRFLVETPKCISQNSGKYTQEFTTQCGLNMRYHGSDIRKQAPEAFLFKFREDKNTGMGDISKVEVSLNNTITIIDALIRLRSLLVDFIPSILTPEVIYQRYLNKYNTDPVFRQKNNEIALDILCLPHSEFDTVFTTGTTISGSSTGIYSSIIKKQIDECSPDKVQKIFSFIANYLTKVMIYRENSADFGQELARIRMFRYRSLQKPRDVFENSTIKTFIASKEPELKIFYENISRAPPNSPEEKFEEFIKFTSSKPGLGIYAEYASYLKSLSIPSSEKFQKLMVLTASCLSSPKIYDILVPYYAVYMDVYTLLRIERNYHKARSLVDEDGYPIPESEYYQHRPAKTECVVIYAGLAHTNNYAQYFSQKPGAKVVTYIPSQPGGFVTVDDLITRGDSDSSRCVDISYPLSALWLPETTNSEKLFVSSSPLF